MAWATGAPTRRDYEVVVSELSALRLVGEEAQFDGGPHVPVTHMVYFKPSADAFLSQLKAKDRRSATEWGTHQRDGGMNGTMPRGDDVGEGGRHGGNGSDFGRGLKIAEDSLKVAFEVVSMRGPLRCWGVQGCLCFPPKCAPWKIFPSL